MTKPDPLATVIALISLGIAFVALLISWQAKQIQRADHELNRQAAKERGRLKAVEGLNRNKRQRLGIGFRILNGPDEVNVSRASISMRYTIDRPSAVWRGDVEFTFDVQSDEFGVLGITRKGDGFKLKPFHDFSLKPFHEEEWRFPLAVSWYLPDPPAEEEGGGDRRYQQIEFTFSVTASGHKVTSTRENLLGGWCSKKKRFGYRRQGGALSSLEVVILAALANEARRGIKSASIPVPNLSLDELVGRGFDMPSGLQKWLVDAWEQAGRFDEEETEQLARALVRLRPPHPDPELLAALLLAESQNQPASLSERIARAMQQPSDRDDNSESNNESSSDLDQQAPPSPEDEDNDGS